MKLKKIAKAFNRFGEAVRPQTAARLLGDKQPYQMFRIIVACVATFMAVNVFAAPYVTNVVAKQRYPWNGLVDITVTLSGTEEECEAATFPFYVTNKTTRAELPIGSVKAVGTIAGAGNTWTRRFVWNATADVGCAKFGEVELTVGIPSIGVQLWENGPYWAECNVGASKPEECGYYFWWGDTVGYKRNVNNNGWISVKDSSSFYFVNENCPTRTKSNSELQSAGYIDATGNLVAEHDAATAHLGAPWRMPTGEELSALINNCDTEWTSCNGVSGCRVKGRGVYALKSIFLPAAGWGDGAYREFCLLDGAYWLSAPYAGRSNEAFELYFDEYGKFEVRSYFRAKGMSVRPVRGVSQ